MNFNILRHAEYNVTLKKKNLKYCKKNTKLIVLKKHMLFEIFLLKVNFKILYQQVGRAFDWMRHYVPAAARTCYCICALLSDWYILHIDYSISLMEQEYQWIFFSFTLYLINRRISRGIPVINHSVHQFSLNFRYSVLIDFKNRIKKPTNNLLDYIIFLTKNFWIT